MTITSQQAKYVKADGNICNKLDVQQLQYFNG